MLTKYSGYIGIHDDHTVGRLEFRGLISGVCGLHHHPENMVVPPIMFRSLGS